MRDSKEGRIAVVDRIGQDEKPGRCVWQRIDDIVYRCYTVPRAAIMSGGYHILDRLGTTAGSELCRARRRRDQTLVLLKLLEPTNPAPARVALFRAEYDLIRSLSISGVARPIAFLDECGQVMMALEDFAGQTLEVILRQRRLDLLVCLRVAAQLTRILAGLHAAQVIHQDVRPANILVGPEFDKICL